MALTSNRPPKGRGSVPADRQARQQDVFLREVDDALREDELATALRKYGRPAAAAIVLGLAALGGGLWYSNHQSAVAGEQGETFTMALDQIEGGRLQTGADTAKPLLDKGNPGYRAAVRLLEAGLALERNKPDDAAKAYAAVAADSNAPQAYRDVATIREVAVRFDKMAPQQVIDRLKPLAVAGNPWFGSAGELVGMAYMKAGKTAEAGALFGQIARDKSVPESLRSRVRQMAGLLGVDAIEDPETAARTIPGGGAAAQ